MKWLPSTKRTWFGLKWDLPHSIWDRLLDELLHECIIPIHPMKFYSVILTKLTTSNSEVFEWYSSNGSDTAIGYFKRIISSPIQTDQNKAVDL